MEQEVTDSSVYIGAAFAAVKSVAVVQCTASAGLQACMLTRL